VQLDALRSQSPLVKEGVSVVASDPLLPPRLFLPKVSFVKRDSPAQFDYRMTPPLPLDDLAFEPSCPSCVFSSVLRDFFGHLTNFQFTFFETPPPRFFLLRNELGSLLQRPQNRSPSPSGFIFFYSENSPRD